MSDIQKIIGKTCTAVERKDLKYDGDSILFTCDDGTKFKMYHNQYCCEDVNIEEITGDLEDLVGSPILAAEERTDDGLPPLEGDYTPESYTWTFYTFRTLKGTVGILWYGSSNGYYSESADFDEVQDGD